MTVLKYVEPAPMGTNEEPRPVTTTNMDYDKQQLRTLIKGQLMGVGMMAVLLRSWLDCLVVMRDWFAKKESDVAK